MKGVKNVEVTGCKIPGLEKPGLEIRVFDSAIVYCVDIR